MKDNFISMIVMTGKMEVLTDSEQKEMIFFQHPLFKFL